MNQFPLIDIPYYGSYLPVSLHAWQVFIWGYIFRVLPYRVLYSYKYIELCCRIQFGCLETVCSFWGFFELLSGRTRKAFSLGLILAHYWNSPILRAVYSTSMPHELQRFPVWLVGIHTISWPCLSFKNCPLCFFGWFFP